MSSTYFAEGYPYAIVNNLAEILFKELGASLQVVGLTSLFHLPWNLKFLWGPLVDEYETKRRWLIGVEVALTAVLVVLSVFVAAGPMLGVYAALFTIMAVASATHDIAIDGYYLEGLDEEGQSKFVGYRAMAYRVASMLVAGPGLIAVGYIGWSAGFVVMTAVMALITLLHLRILPRVEQRKRPIAELLSTLFRFRVLAAGAIVAGLVLLERELVIVRPVWDALRAAVAGLPGLGKVSTGGWIALALIATLVIGVMLRGVLSSKLRATQSAYARAFIDFLDQPKVGRVLAFVVLFRAGESFLMKMKWPFLDDVVGMQLDQYGFANGTVGLVCSFSATMLGGWLISKHGLRRWIWPFVMAQNLLNLLYVGLAWSWFGDDIGIGLLTGVIAVERIGEGLGTAVFMVYLMRCCDPAHKAAHMAIVTALMSVAFTIAGVVSGFLADAWGFGAYFAFTFVATFPAMVLIFFIPHLDGRESAG